MRNLLTKSDIANQARMLRSAFSGSILVVEGETDARLFNGFVTRHGCQILVAQNKDNAIGAAMVLDSQGYSGVLTLVDADFWHLDGVLPPSPNMVLTDTHDIETMIIASGALEKILAEFGDQQKFRALPKPIRDVLEEAACVVGLLRWHSHLGRLNLRFKGMRFIQFLDRKTLTVDIGKLIEEVQTNSRSAALNKPATVRAISQLAGRNPAPLQVCSGHDLADLLTVALNCNCGNSRGKKVTISFVRSALRLAYEYRYFSCTQLFATIKNWEKRNTPYVVLAERIETS